MTYEDYLIAKLIAITVAAFAWGLYCGATGRALDGRKERDAAPPRVNRQ